VTGKKRGVVAPVDMPEGRAGEFGRPRGTPMSWAKAKKGAALPGESAV